MQTTFILDMPVHRDYFFQSLSSSVRNEIVILTKADIKFPFSDIRLIKLNSSYNDYNALLAEIIDVISVISEGKPFKLKTYNEGFITVLSQLEKDLKTLFPLSYGLVSRSKGHIRETLRSSGFKHPKHFMVDSSNFDFKQLEELSFQNWIAKPDLGMGGRSVRSGRGKQELLGYLSDDAREVTIYNLGPKKLNIDEYYGLSKKTLIEEVVYGQEYSIECFVHLGKIFNMGLTKKITSGSPYYIEIAHVCTHPACEGMDEEALNSIMTKVIEDLRVFSSVIHVEFIRTNANDLFLVEINLRPAGGKIPLIWSLASDFDFNLAHLFPESVKPKNDIFIKPSRKIFIGHKTVMRKRKIIEEDLLFPDDIITESKIMLHENYVDSGDIVEPIPTERSVRYGVFIAESPNKMKLKDVFYKGFLR